MRVLALLLLAGCGLSTGQSIWEQVQSGVERLGTEGRRDMGRLGGWMQPHIARLGEGVGRVGDSVGPVLSDIGERMTSLGGHVTNLTEQAGRVVGPVVEQVEQVVGPVVEQVVGSLGERVQPAMDRVGEQVGGLVDGLVDTVKESPMFRERLDRSDSMVIVRGEDGLAAPPEVGPGLLGRLGSIAGRIGTQLGRLSPVGGRWAAREADWWEGPGVCTEREVVRQEERTERVNVNGRGFGVLTMAMEESVCREEGDRYECRTGLVEGGVRKVIVVRYRCCHGYRREEGRGGCTQVSMKSLVETVREQGGAEFLALVEEAGELDRLRTNMTVFVPTAAAVEEFHRTLMEYNTLETGSGYSNEVVYNVDSGLSYGYRRKREIVIAEAPRPEDSVLTHLTRGFVTTQQMQDEGLLVTEAPGGGRIRTTVYRTRSEKVVMANCARITARDLLATNGVVHVVDKMIQPAHHTLGQILDADLGFSQFSRAVKESGLLPMLEDTAGHYTVFAPTDRAIMKLDRKTREVLLSGSGCAGTILKAHILPNVLCSGVVHGRARTNSLLGDLVLLERNGKNVLSVEGVQMIMTDIMATNGVVHVIDEVIVPQAAKSISAVLTERKLTGLRDLLEETKLMEEVESLSNVTIFLPTAAALAELPVSHLETLATEPARLLEFVLLHVSRPATRLAGLTDGLLLDTEVRDHQIRISRFSRTNALFGETDRVVTAQCGRVSGPGEEVCGGLVHTVDRVLLPSPPSVLELVRARPEFSRFVALLELSGVVGELDGAPELGRTLLAPTNAAFSKLDKNIEQKLTSDKAFARTIAQKHILEGVLCCMGIQKNNLFFNSSRRQASAGQVSVRRTASGHLYADRAEISKCDMMAGDGVVLQLESVLT